MTAEKLRAAQKLLDEIEKLSRIIKSSTWIFVSKSGCDGDFYKIGPFNSSENKCLDEVKKALSDHLDRLMAEFEKL